MCYERRRVEVCVDESAHHALPNAGGREIVGKKEGEKKGSARGSVHWGCLWCYLGLGTWDWDGAVTCHPSPQGPKTYVLCSLGH